MPEPSPVWLPAHVAVAVWLPALAERLSLNSSHLVEVIEATSRPVHPVPLAVKEVPPFAVENTPNIKSPLLIVILLLTSELIELCKRMAAVARTAFGPDHSPIALRALTELVLR